MIQRALKELAKQLFWLIAVTMIVGLPFMVFAAPTLDANPTFDGVVATSTGWYVLAAMAGFTLVIVGIIVFWIFPTLIELGEAIWKARQDANGDMFP